MIKKLFKNKKFKFFICVMLGLCILAAGSVVGINAYMISYADDYLLGSDKLSDYEFDCIIVLGAGLWDGEPSPMLKERLDFGIEAYNTGCSEKFLMSGDHGTEIYDEVNTMKDYVIDKGVLKDNVFLDHAGFSTYESMYRAKEVFKSEKVLIITQKYHLSRAVYNARKLGLDAYGYDREELQYPITNDMREFLARVKDFIWCIVKPEPTYLGEEIPIKTASASLTDDKVRV